jgi:hypothetical protein
MLRLRHRIVANAITNSREIATKAKRRAATSCAFSRDGSTSRALATAHERFLNRLLFF